MSAWQRFWAAGWLLSNDSSSVFFGPQLRLPGGHPGAVEFNQARLPFVYQFRGLTRSPLGTGKHSLRVDALLSRFVWFAGGMIGHMILTLTEKRCTTGFYTSSTVTEEGACPRRAGSRLIGLGYLSQDVRRFDSRRSGGGLQFRFRSGFCGVRFECGEDEGGGLLNDFETLGEERGIAMIKRDVARAPLKAEYICADLFSRPQLFPCSRTADHTLSGQFSENANGRAQPNEPSSDYAGACHVSQVSKR